jgi:hypothetical protein
MLLYMLPPASGMVSVHQQHPCRMSLPAPGLLTAVTCEQQLLTQQQSTRSSFRGRTAEQLVVLVVLLQLVQ